MSAIVAKHLLPFLRQQQTATRFLIAFSGGLDSHVLLHLCAALQVQYPYWQFRAIHIDHGLQAESPDWAAHCGTVCGLLAMPLVQVALHLQIPPGASLEAEARQARYDAFAQHLQTDEMLLTAHHQDDQAETLLLHLLRGSGVDGLAAMPAVRAFAQGWLGRPLLGCSREDLAAYAHQHALHYLQDPSNADSRFDRNFLRHQVMPVLRQRWPAVARTFARAARLQGESRQLLHDCVQEKLPYYQGSCSGTLAISQLRTASLALQAALLRSWLANAGFLLPSAKKLERVLHDVLLASADAMPCVCWAGCEIRRYRDDLYAMRPLAAHDAAQVWYWDAHQTLVLPTLGITLIPEMLGAWLPLARDAGGVTVRFRQGGETMELPYRGGSHALKHLLQEAGIPPWQRERLPLIYVGERLVNVVGVLQVNP